MKVRSAKDKGRRLQNLVRDRISQSFPELELDTDIRSAIMGETGEDIKLSKKARLLFPYSVECKSLKSMAVFRYLEQAQSNCPTTAMPLVVIKENRKKPLAVIDFEYFMGMIDDTKDT